MVDTLTPLLPYFRLGCIIIFSYILTALITPNIFKLARGRGRPSNVEKGFNVIITILLSMIIEAIFGDVVGNFFSVAGGPTNQAIGYIIGIGLAFGIIVQNKLF